MFSSTVMPVLVARACGHVETEELRYRGTRDKNQQMSMARRVFCSDCRALIEGWLNSPVEAASSPIELPTLCGSDKQVSWASSIRATQLKRLLPAMTAAAAHGDKIGTAVWLALYVVVSQCQAKFWIDNREIGFTRQFIETEASYFAMGVTYGMVFSERSIFGNLKKHAPHKIEEARRRCPVAPARSIA